MVPLTTEEIELARTPDEWSVWIDHRLTEFTEDKKRLRSGIGLYKELVEESLPIAHFATHHYGHRDNVTIKHVLGSQSYDAVVSGPKDLDPLIEHLEVTQAHEGEDAYLRMHALNECGHVSASGEVVKRGTKRSGLQVAVIYEAEDGEEFLDKLRRRVEDAVKKKYIKNKYPVNTALIVAFEDLHPLPEDRYADCLRSVAANYYSSLLDANFVLIAFVGMIRKTYLEYRLTNPLGGAVKL